MENKAFQSDSGCSYREITTAEKKELKTLISSKCANYEGYYKECLLLDTECPMLLKHYHNGKLCKYLRETVLPTHTELEASLLGVNNTNKECPICKKRFYSETNKKYCSDFCTQKAKKEADKQRAKKYRQNKG